MASMEDGFHDRVQATGSDRYRSGERQTARELEALQRRLALAASSRPVISDPRAAQVSPSGQRPAGWLRQELQDQRAVISDKLRECPQLDRGIRRRWIEDLERIDLYDARAGSRVQQLYARIEHFREDIPYRSGPGSPSTAWTLKADLGQVAQELWQLGRLCAAYADRFGGAARR